MPNLISDNSKLVRHVQRGTLKSILDIGRISYRDSNDGNDYYAFQIRNFEVALSGFLNADKMVYILSPYGGFSQKYKIDDSDITSAYGPFLFTPFEYSGVNSKVIKFLTPTINLTSSKLVFAFDGIHTSIPYGQACRIDNQSYVNFAYQVIEFY